MHADEAALVGVGDDLDHGSEDVGVDVGPLQVAEFDEVAAGGAGEAGDFDGAAEQTAVYVGESVRPAWQVLAGGVVSGGVHRFKQDAQHVVDVAAVVLGHFLDGAREDRVAAENLGVFGEKAEDQAGHEVVHLFAAIDRGPLRVVGKEVGVEAAQAICGADVHGVVFDFRDHFDAGQRQEGAEMVRELAELARDKTVGGF